MNEHTISRQLHDVERIEYRCQRCEAGVYRFNRDGRRIDANKQLPHSCNVCGHEVYFSIPYPALRYRGRLFVDWQTVRSQSV